MSDLLGYIISLGSDPIIAPVAGTGAITAASTLISTYVNNKKAIRDERQKVRIRKLLFGDPDCTAIVPGNTNKLLLAKNNGIPKMSRYVEIANEKASELFSSLYPNSPIDPVHYFAEKADVSKYKNLLLLGGPIASGLTKSLCGYKDEPITCSANSLKVTDIPIYNHRRLFPAYFDVGTQERPYKVIYTKRPDQDGKPTVEGTYKIIYKGKELIPIRRAGRLRSDMLMIIKIPNPWHSNGHITVIGGMHGYSLEAFFANKIEKNLEILNKLCSDYAYFQMLIPAEIDDNGRAKLIWDTHKWGWGDWKFSLDGLNRSDHIDIPDELKVVNPTDSL